MARRKAKNQITPLEQLELFVARCEQMKKTRLIATGSLSGGIRIRGETMPEGIVVTSELIEPNEDDLRSFLLTFRQFTMQNEPIFVQKIFDLCQLHLKDENLKQELIKARNHWKELTDK